MVKRSLIAVGLLVAALVAGCERPGASDASAATATPVPNGLQEQLRQYAVRELAKGKLVEVCNKLLDEKIDSTFGEMTVKVSGTERKLPGILVRHRYVCQENIPATKEGGEQWAVLALDAEFDLLRCVRTGPPHDIVFQSQQCGFKPQDPAFTFPPAEQVEMLWRADYAKALARLETSASKANPAEAWSSYKPLFVGDSCFQSDEGLLAAPWGNTRQPLKEASAVSADGKSMTNTATFADGEQGSVTYYRSESDCKAANRGSVTPQKS